MKLTITPPPCFGHLPLEEVRTLLRRLLDERVAQVHAEREAEGLTHFMGMEAVLAQDPLASVGDTFPTFARNPTICGRDTERRIARIRGLQAFRHAYRVALDRWRDGDREAVFPYGSYWLPHFHGANVERAPP